MAILAAPGNDIPLAPERMDGYRAFANKLWNATRFVLLKAADAPPAAIPEHGLGLAERWILSRAEVALAAVNDGLASYRFDRAADALYHFVWHEFCDRYIEMAKLALAGSDAAGARAVLLSVLDRVLRMLHPFMPFVTEELWHRLPGERQLLAVSAWPSPDPRRVDPAAEHEAERLQAVAVAIRNLRAEAGIEPHRAIDVLVEPGSPDDGALLEREAALIALLARAATLRVVADVPADLVAARSARGGVRLAIPHEGVLDVGAERDLRKVEQELAQRAARLADDVFISRAKPVAVEKERRIHRELTERRQQLVDTLAGLGVG
jgi:valyl-tRNA synthetase